MPRLRIHKDTLKPDHDSARAAAITQLVSPGRGYRTAFIGDSLIHKNVSSSWSGGAGTISGVPTAFPYLMGSWVTWLQTLSFGAIRAPVWLDQTERGAGWQVVGAERGFTGMNFGVSGQNSGEILRRLDGTDPTQILSMDFDVAFLEGGTNDVKGGIYTPQQTAANMLRCLDLLIERGIFVLFLPIRSRNLTDWPLAQYRRNARYINQMLREGIAKRPNCLYIDWDRAWTDSTTTDGEPFSGYSLDGVHDSAPGGFAIAKYMWFGKIGDVQVWPGLQHFFPPQTDLYTVREDVFDATHNPKGNRYTNGKMAGTGGSTANGASGSVADSQRVERSAASGSTTVVASKATAPANDGFRQVLTFTNGGTAAETFYTPRLSSPTLDVSALAGQWLEVYADVEVKQAYDKAHISVYCRDNANLCVYRGMGVESGMFLPNELWAGRIYTPPIYLGPAPTNVTPRVETIVTGGGTGNLVMEVGNICVRTIEDPRLRYGWDGPTYGE